MRLITAILLTALFAALASWFFPWWTIAVVALLVAFAMRQPVGKSILAGFLGIALLWLVWILIKDIPNEHILSSKMAVLFVKQPNYVLFIAINVLLGGIVGGLSAWGGALLRKAVA